MELGIYPTVSDLLLPTHEHDLRVATSLVIQMAVDHWRRQAPPGGEPVAVSWTVSYCDWAIISMSWIREVCRMHASSGGEIRALKCSLQEVVVLVNVTFDTSCCRPSLWVERSNHEMCLTQDDNVSAWFQCSLSTIAVSTCVIAARPEKLQISNIRAQAVRNYIYNVHAYLLTLSSYTNWSAFPCGSRCQLVVIIACACSAQPPCRSRNHFWAYVKTSSMVLYYVSCIK
jgi:hypothetical protein